MVRERAIWDHIPVTRVERTSMLVAMGVCWKTEMPPKEKFAERRARVTKHTHAWPG